MIALAIARLTVADALRNPATWAATMATLVLIATATVFGMFTFDVGDRIRMLATAGLAAAGLHGLFLACLLATVAIRGELEARTALTLFSHPVGRGSWLLGKTMGVWVVVALTFIPIAVIHLALMWAGWRTGFDLDRKETAFDADTILPIGQTVVGYSLALMQVAVLTVIAVVISLRVAFMGALAMMAAMYLAGNALGAAGWPGLVLIPALHVYLVDDAVQGFSRPVELPYIAAAFAHTALTVGGWMLIGLALFRDHDLP